MEENTNINTQPTQQPQPQQPYQQNQMPVAQLNTDRGLAKLLLLSLITFGIYGLVVMYGMTEDVNTVCGRYDGKRSMNYLLMVLILTPITLGIYPMVWYHTISNRIGAELTRRGIDFKFSATDYWLWNVLGLLIVVGPFVYLYKLIKAVNLLNADFNVKG